MNPVARILIWWLIWTAGCLAFDLWLGLTGPWLMACGAATYMLCNTVNKTLKRTEQ